MEKWLPFAFPVLFPIFWCFICFLLAHLGGWSALAARFRTTELPQGKMFSMQSAQVGNINYSSCLKFHVNDSGIFLAVFPLFRVGHPPLFIPWPEFNNFREKKILFWRFVEASVGTPPIARILLPRTVFPIQDSESDSKVTQVESSANER